MDENNSWFTELVNEYARIKGIELDITRPNDLCEVLMPTKDIPDETKICLYDLIEYLTSEGRSMLLMAISMGIPYLAENAKRAFNNKFKALARLELELIECKDERISYLMGHNEYEEMETKFCPIDKRRTGKAPVPTTLLGIDLSDYLTEPTNPLVDFVIRKFKDKNLTSVEAFGSDVNPWGKKGNGEPKLS